MIYRPWAQPPQQNGVLKCKQAAHAVGRPELFPVGFSNYRAFLAEWQGQESGEPGIPQRIFIF